MLWKCGWSIIQIFLQFIDTVNIGIFYKIKSILYPSFTVIRSSFHLEYDIIDSKLNRCSNCMDVLKGQCKYVTIPNLLSFEIATPVKQVERKIVMQLNVSEKIYFKNFSRLIVQYTFNPQTYTVNVHVQIKNERSEYIDK